MKLKKVKCLMALIVACTCVGSGFSGIQVQAFQATEPQQTESNTEEEKVTFGVVSDTHVGPSKKTEQARLAEAFQRYSDLGMDTAVVVGDLTDRGSEAEYETWENVKDENLKIPLIASMGNHEGNSAAGFLEATGNIPNNNQVVNGYHFITLSPGSGTLDETTGRGSSQGGGTYTYAVDWLKEQLDAAVAEDPEKPIFVFFHHPIKDTFYVSHEWYGYGLEEVFKNYPQVVTFSGHIHSPNNNPTSIWQDGGYTAVNTVTLSYMELETGMIYGSIPPNANNVAQGLEVSVDGSVVTIKNYDFIADEYLDQTWTFDVTKKLPYTDERKEKAVAPEFDETDKITLSDVSEDSVKIEFDQASVPENSVGDIVHSYRYDFIDKATGEVKKTFKTFSEYYFTPMPETITQVASDLNPGTEYELRVYAIDAYDLVSENYLSETFKTTGEDDSTLTFEDMAAGIPTADLLDVDFSNGVLEDHSAEKHTFYGGNENNIKMNDTLGKYTAKFSGLKSEAFCTDWTIEQYKKTNDGFTMESVVYVDAFNDGYVNFFGNMQSAGIGFEIYPNSDDATKADASAWVHINGGYKVPKATAAINFNAWNHMAVTYNGKKVILYVNGEKVASVAASGNVTTPAEAVQYYVIGGDSSFGGVESPLSGEVSTARMYSEPLTEKQIKMLANRDLKSLDTEKPMLQKEGNAAETGKQNETYNIPAAKAADNSTAVTLKAEIVDGNNQVVYAIGGDSASVEASTFTFPKAGSYKLIYSAVDAAGNSITDEVAIVVKASQEEVELPVANVMNVDFTGGDATDKSEMANSYRVLGNPTVIESSELHKKVAHFDGSSAYLYPFDDTKYEKIKDTVTIECMFKYDNIPSSGEYDMFSNQQSGGIGLGLENGALNFFAHVDGGYKQPKTAIQAGQWVHAVGVVDGSAVKLYVNGKLVDQIAANGGVSYPASDSAKNFLIGADSNNDNGAQFWAEGSISLARVYDRALSEKEITALCDKAFEGADIEKVQPQQVNLGIVSAETAPAGGEMSVNLHANGAEAGSVDKITYELNYDANLLTYSGVQYNVSGLTIDDSTAGKLKVTYKGGLTVADFKQYASTRLGQILFKVKETNENVNTTLKTENFQAFAEDEDVTGKMDMPQAEKQVTIYTNDSLDLNGDGVVGAGDVALAGNQDQKKAIAEEAAIYPYKHAVVLTTDGGGSAWCPEWIYYTNSTQTLPAKTSDPAIMEKRTNEYTMKLLNEEFATSYTATAVEPSISGQNYSAILHGIPWKDADAAHRVTNDSASKEYYGDFGLATAKYPSMFKAVQKAAPSRSLTAFSEWTEILNGIIEPDAGVVGRPSTSKESFYDVAKYIKSNEYKNTAIVYMQSDWMDHMGHSVGYYTDGYWKEYKQFDDYFKAVVDALKETGTYDETLIIANADHGGSGTGHGSTDPSNMDVFIGIGGQTVNSGKRLEGGNNSDIAAIALEGLRVEKPDSMTGKVFDEATFLTQEEMSKKNRDIEKVAFVRTGETGTLTLSNAKAETRVIDAVIDLDGASVKNIDAAGGTILRQEVEEGQLKLTIAYEKQPEKLAEITFGSELSEQTKVNEIMLGTEEGNEVYPDLENKTEAVSVNKEALNQKIAYVNTLVKDQYTEESWKELENVLKMAQTVSANPAVKQAEVSQVHAALETAIASLVLKEVEPTVTPTAIPTVQPTAEPTVQPTAEPTVQPTAEPTATPTVEPTAAPTATPTVQPTAAPTATPTVEPTAEPTAIPTVQPTAEPTATPTVQPTAEPTAQPTAEPTAQPTVQPTAEPTATPKNEKLVSSYHKKYEKVYGAKSFKLDVDFAKEGLETTYTTSNKKVVTVEKNGKVKIKGTGICDITVKVKDNQSENQEIVKIQIVVKPKRASIKKAVVKAKTIALKWEQDSMASGYQIEYATDSKFNKNNKNITINKKTKTSTTLKKLKSGKKYYVRVRSYKIAKDGKKNIKLYGSWSKVKVSKKIQK